MENSYKPYYALKGFVIFFLLTDVIFLALVVCYNDTKFFLNPFAILGLFLMLFFLLKYNCTIIWTDEKIIIFDNLIKKEYMWVEFPYIYIELDFSRREWLILSDKELSSKERKRKLYIKSIFFSKEKVIVIPVVYAIKGSDELIRIIKNNNLKRF